MTATIADTYATYTDAELEAAATDFADAAYNEAKRTARLGFGDGGAYYRNALHGVALVMHGRRAATAPVTPLRRGTRVLSHLGEFTGVGHVEGTSTLGTESAYVVRWANGVVDTWETHEPVLVAVDWTTTLVQDEWNNVGRHCSVRGDAAAGHPVRCWRVVAAVSGGRYLVERLDGEGYAVQARLVAHRDMTNLY